MTDTKGADIYVLCVICGMQEVDLAKRVFDLGTKETVIWPPDQVFLNSEFDFLFTMGGHLANDAEEYTKFTNYIKALGEEEFFLLENLGATESINDKPFTAKFSTTEGFEEFHQTVRSFDPPFGFYINHFYVFGQRKDWGIYICEYPTIKIIGCLPELKQGFANVFSITDNGYVELQTFTDSEFSLRPELKKPFLINYKISE